MQKIGAITSSWMRELDPELQKAATASRVRHCFAQAVLDVFTDEKAAHFILGHIQAVYIMHETDKAVLAKSQGKAPIILRIYSDDSTVRAEVDARQEFIRVALAKRNITYGRCQILASKLGMKKREPLISVLELDSEEPEDVTRHDLNEQERENLAARITNPEVAESFRRVLQATSKDA